MEGNEQLLWIVGAFFGALLLMAAIGKRLMPKDPTEKPAPPPPSPWELLGRKHGGSLRGEERVEIAQHGIELTIELRRVPGRDQRHYVVRAATEYRLGRGPAFQVRDVGVVAAFAKLAGAEDVTTGDAPFDDQFTVEADDAEAVRRVLTEPARSTMKAIAQNRDLHSDGRHVVLEVAEPEPDLELLDRMASLTSELASYEDPGLARLLRVLGATLDRGAEDGEMSHAVVASTHASVRVGPRRYAPSGSLSAWALAPCPPFEARLDDGTLEGSLPAQTGADSSQLRAIGRAVLRGDGREVVLEWASWPERDEALRAGVRFLDGLAAPPSAGAFR